MALIAQTEYPQCDYRVAKHPPPPFFYLRRIIDRLAIGNKTFTRSEILNVNALAEGKADPEAPFLMIIDNKVYDIREFVPDHPGGGVILTHVGKDGTGKHGL